MLPGLPVPATWTPRCLKPGYSLRMDARFTYLCREGAVVATIDPHRLRPIRPGDVDNALRAAMLVDEVAQAVRR